MGTVEPGCIFIRYIRNGPHDIVELQLHYPLEPAEEHVKETREYLLASCGLSSSCEFVLIRSGRFYSLRSLPPGTYEMRMIKLASPIPRLTSSEPSNNPDGHLCAISLSGTCNLIKRGRGHLLQAIVRVSCSPMNNAVQRKITVRLETHKWGFVEKSPENETRTLAVTARSGWEGHLSGGMKGDLAGGIKYSRTQETREELLAWRTVTREIVEDKTKRHFLDWMHCEADEDRFAACKGCQWEVQHVKETGQIYKDAQASHSLTKVYSADIDIGICSANTTVVRLPITVECEMLKSSPSKWRCQPQVFQVGVCFLVSCKMTREPFMVDTENTCLGFVETQPARPSVIYSFTKNELSHIKLIKLKEIKGGKSSLMIKLNLLPALSELALTKCHYLRKLDFGCHGPDEKVLKILDFSGCWALANLPDNFSEFYLPQLERINLTGCWSLERLPDPLSRHVLPKLQALVLKDCVGLRHLPNCFREESMPDLQEIVLEGCSKLGNLPCSLVDRQKSVKVLGYSGRANLLLGQIPRSISSREHSPLQSEGVEHIIRQNTL